MTAPAPDLLERVRRALSQDYEVLRPLGQGGMATVFLARERALKRLVAIKLLDPDLGAAAIFRTRFEREAETAAALQHPNIVPIFRVGEADGLAYYAMGYVEGESLADRLRGRGRLGYDEVRRVAREIAEALRAAHRRGIIHRDIKPQNVLIDRETGRAMVTDFGIASVAIAGQRGGAHDALTGAGMVMGTPRYMSPEQAAGERDLTPASDLYALGVVLYELLTGAYPYRLGEPPNFLLAHLTGEVIPPVTRIGDMPRDLEQVVLRLLAKAPEQRYPSAEALLGDLAGGDEGAGRAPARRRPRRWRAAALAALAGTAAWAFVLFGRGGEAPVGSDPRRSVLVGFFANSTQDPELDWVRDGGVDLLSQGLARWTDLQVVSFERLLDLARRVGLPPGQRLSEADLYRLAREAGVWTGTLGTVVRQGDSIVVTVKVYAVEQEQELFTVRRAVGSTEALQAAFVSLADEILGASGIPASQRVDAEPPTRSLAAYRAYIEGIAARSRWDIPEAVAAFRRAVREDPAFALGWYELSQAITAESIFSPDPSFVAYADSALRYAAGRPPRERQLIEAYHAFVAGDMPGARRRFRELLAADSTLVDAWVLLGAASQTDLTLVRDEAGRERLPADYTEAVRAYRRVLALDANDHRVYALLAQALAAAGFRENRAVPAYRDAPAGGILSLGMRVPSRWYTPLRLDDSTITLVPAESLTMRYAPRVVDSLRAAARDAAAALVRRWLAVAPEEGQAHLTLASLSVIDREYDAALGALARAESLGVTTPIPLPIQQLQVLLLAHRFEDAARLGDSLAPRGAAPRVPTPIVASPVAAYLFTRGRVTEGMALQRAAYGQLARFEPTERLRRRVQVSEATMGVRLAARAGTVTAAQLDSADRALRRIIAEAPEAERAEVRSIAARGLSFGAAALGDTARLGRWVREVGTDSLVVFEAAAAAVAGDRARAEALYARAARDTTSSASYVFTKAATAEALGRPAEALRWHERLDSLETDPGASESDFVLLARAEARRGALRAQLGDTTGAITAYRRFLALWSDPDPALRREREAVQRALDDLTRPRRDR